MDRRAIAPERRAEMIEAVLSRLKSGESMNLICASDGMPSDETMRRWCADDRELADRVYQARETGYHTRAERAVEAAKTCDDPIKGRLAFDAERWYLGKLSNAFAERAPRIDSQTSVQVNIDGDPFGRIAELMDVAAVSVASRAERTHRLADESKAGSGSA